MSAGLAIGRAAAGAPGSKRGWALAGLAGGAVWVLLRSGVLPSLLPACLLREVFGIRCATCGFTTALTQLAHGDVAASFAAHPLGIPVVIELALFWLLWGLGAWSGRPWLRARWVAGVAAFTALAALIVWGLRLAGA